MGEIHSTAVVHDGARLGSNIKIGPYSVIGPEVELGDNVIIESHVVVAGATRIGGGSHIFPFASLGHPPQHKKYAGEKTYLEIGEKNVIREHVTMNPGTAQGGGITRVGRECMFMVNTHVAHDCHIGDHVIFINNAVIGGHVEIGDYAILGGTSAVHQFVRVGKHAMVGGMTGVENDVIPYGSVMGDRAFLAGLNIVGLKRRGYSRDDIHTLRYAYRLLFAEEGTLQERLTDVAQMFATNPLVMDIVEFMRGASNRALCVPRASRGL
jgi:UDP-N-acetylglucosamine acyltransferase